MIGVKVFCILWGLFIITIFDGFKKELRGQEKGKGARSIREGGSKGQEENQALVQGSSRRERAVKVGLGG